MIPIFLPGLFRGRVALVTGGGTGIGLAIAKELGSLGARVVIAARRTDRLAAATDRLGKQGIEASWAQVNIRDENDVDRMFAVLEEEGRIPDILVNNAGGQFSAAALKISANGFRSVIDLNLNGTWHMCRAFAAAPGRKTPSCIVNIVLSIEGGSPNYAHAAAARAGVINLTQTLAIEWATLGMTVNAVAPGTVRTTGLDQYDIKSIERSVAALPIPRMAEVEEVAAAVSFLASPSAQYITGSTIFVDGGKHLAAIPPSSGD